MVQPTPEGAAPVGGINDRSGWEARIKNTHPPSVPRSKVLGLLGPLSLSYVYNKNTLKLNLMDMKMRMYACAVAGTVSLL